MRMRTPWLQTAVSVLILSVNAAGAADLTGAWKLEFKPDASGHPATHDCAFTQTGEKLAIECGGQKITGSVKGRNVTFEHKTGRQNELTMTYRGTLDEKGTTIKGAWRITPEKREGNFEARKQDAK
jgi:hypothetical protein